jgi:hypothetical protein
MPDGTYFTDVLNFKNPEDLLFILEDFEYVYQERSKEMSNTENTERLFQ